jgi:cell division protein FtsQ
VIEVLGGDIGRNIFFIPLAERKAQLEKIPWVESASVMRFVPNRLVVEIHERTPIAFARLGSRISLIDAGGTLMELPVTSKQKYSFPVVVGMNPGEPLSTRTARMKIYNDLVRQLDADGGHYSQDLSEVDVSDPEDVKVLANDPAGAVLVHLGSSDYLTRYKVYVSHVRGWRQQFDKLESVDLRYDHQIIVNPDQQGTAKAPPLTPAAAKAAMAAGVKRAALIHVVNTGKPFGPQALKPPAKQLVATTKIAQPAPTVDKPKPAAKPAKRVARRRRGARKAVAKGAKAETVKPQAKAVPEASDAGKTAASKDTSAANAKAKHPAGKKPSAAIAKNQEQQDHP